MPSRERELEAALKKSRAETRAAFENRALMYAYLYDELEDRIGHRARHRPDEARDLPTRPRGGVVKYRPAAQAGDLAEVARLFVDGSPAQGSLFEPGTEEVAADGERIVLRMTACPLKDAWIAAGYDAAKVDHLCDIAAAVDEGTFEGAGLDLTFLDRQAVPGRRSACSSSRCGASMLAEESGVR